MAFKSGLVVFLIICQYICCVMAADCTTAILASVFGTIGGLLVIAAIIALVWYCCQRRQITSFSSTSSEDTASSDPKFSFRRKTKGGDIGLNGSGTPVTFSHHYSEKAPSAAYNTSGVVNPAFGGGREVLIDMPPGNKEDVKIDMEVDPSIKPPAYNGDVKIDMDGGSGIKTPSGTGDIKLDMDGDHGHDVSFPDGNRPKLNLPDVDLPDDRLSGRGLPGNEANVVIKGPSKPTFDEAGPSLSLEKVDVFLDRPGHGGFGLLIARDKTLPPPALFIREVTPGGVAEKTGLIEKGDKIIAINGTSIEGMPHDQAMVLLRNDEKKILHLTLLKKALYKLKERSFDPPEGSIEKPVSIDMSPELEAGLPSVDFEGIQGDAPDLGTMDISARKPRANMSGPAVFTDVDLGGPSSGLDLPSTKKKSGNCFSCASNGDKDEPYSKGKANAGLDFDGPDMKTGGNVAMRGTGPDISVPSTNTRGKFSGPSVNGEGFELDSSGPNVDISARPKAQIDTNAPDIKTPDVDLSTGKIRGPQGNLHAPTAELDMPSNKKKGGNCFSCAGGTDKDEPYKKRKGNADFNFDGPDGSMEMRTDSNFDISRSGPNIEGPDGGIKQKDFGLRASAPDVDLNVDEGRHMDISSPDVSLPSSSPTAKISGPSFDGDVDVREPNVNIKTRKPQIGIDANAPDIKPSTGRPDIDVSTGKVKGTSIKYESPSADMDLPSTKKRGNCLTCTGISDKGEPYSKARNNAGYDFDGPDVDGSMEMKNVSGPSIHASGPDLDISAKRPKAGLSTNAPGINAPEGRLSTDMSGPDVEMSTGKMRGPRAQVGGPSAEVDLPSSKKKGGNCFSCAASGDKDEPYRATKGKTGFDLNGPDVDGSMEMKKTGKLDISGSGPEFDVNGPKAGLSGPPFDASGPDLDISAKRPIAGLSTNAPGINAPEGRLNTDMPGPHVEMSTGKMRGPGAQVGGPSAEVDLPSSKKKGGNCFSCAAIGDKDEPYRATKGKTGFDLNGPEVDGSMEMKKTGKLDIIGSGPALDASGPRAGLSGPAFDASGPRAGLSGPAFDASGPRAGLSGPAFDASGPRAGLSGPAFDASGPRAGLSGPAFDASGPRAGLSGPAFDASGPRAGLSGPAFDASGPDLDISAKRPIAGLSTNAPAINAPEGRLSTDMSGPDVEMSTGKMRGPGAQVGGPSAEVDLPSSKKKGGNCFSCAASGDKDEPYRATKGKTGFDLNGPEVDGSMEMKKTGKLDISGSGPEFDVNGPRAGLSGPAFDANGPDLDISAKRPIAGLSTNAPGINAPEGRLSTDMSGPDVEMSTGKMRGPRAQVGGPSAEVDLPSSKKKGGNCFSCAASGDKDEPYRATKGKTGFNLNGPEVDGSMEMKKTGKLDIIGSGPALDASGPRAGLSGAAFDASGPRAGLSGPAFDASGPRAGLSGPAFDASGPDLDISAKRPKAGLSTNAPGINAPEGRLSTDMSGPDVEMSTGKMRGPRAQVGGPSAEVDLPSSKKKGGNCFSCAASGDKDEPYRATKGKTGFDLNGPEVDGSMEMKKTGKLDIIGSGPALDASGPRAGLSGPALDASGPRAGLSGPALDASGSRAGLTGPEFDVSGPKTDLSVKDINAPSMDSPSAELGLPSWKKKGGNCWSCAGSADKDEPYGKTKGNAEFGFNGPDVNVSTGDVRGPKANLHAPSADGSLPSRKKTRGNCLSCAGDADKDEPYGRPSGNADFNLDTPDIDESLKVKKSGNFDLRAPSTDIKGPEIEVNNTDIDLASDKPKMNFKSPELNIPKAGGKGEIDIKRPQFSHDRPKISGPSIGTGDLGIDTPQGHGDWGISKPHLPVTPRADITGPSIPGGDFDIDANLPGLGISGGKPKSGLDMKAFDTDTPVIPAGDLRFGVSRPDVDFSAKKPAIDVGGLDKNNIGADGKFDLDVNLPDLDVSATKPSVKGFEIDTPDLDIPAGDLHFGGSSPDVDFSAKKPVIGMGGLGKNNIGADGKLDLDVNRPDLHVSATKPSFGVKGFETDTPDPDIPAGDLRFGGSRPDVDFSAKKPAIGMGGLGKNNIGADGTLDLDVNRPDLDVSATKPRFGVKEFEIDAPDPDIPAGDLRFGGSRPDVAFSAKKPAIGMGGLGKNNIGADGTLDLDVNRPDLDVSATKPRFGVKEFEIDTPDPDIPAGDLCFGGSTPDVDFSAKKPAIGMGGLGKNDIGADGTLDIDVNRPDLDVSATKPRFGVKGFETDTPDLDIPAGDLRFGGSRPDVDFSAKKPAIGMGGLGKNNIGADGKLDLDIDRPDLEISATKPGFGEKGLDADTTEPNGEWSFQPKGKDYDGNFDLGMNTSTPNKEVQLLPHTELGLETEPLEGDISVANNYNFELQSTPKTFPSIDYEEPRSLQRYDEIRPDMELRLLSPNHKDQSDPLSDFEVPDTSLNIGEDYLRPMPGSMSLVKVEENVTICSASLEEDELPSPRNRKLTLDRTVEQKIEVVFPGEEGSNAKQKSSTSSSSSSSSDADADKEKKSKRKKKSRLRKALGKSSTSSVSSSSDDEIGEKRNVEKKGPKERKTSTSSTSSSDKDDSMKIKLSKPSKDTGAPIKYNVEYTTLPKQYLVTEEKKEPEKPESSTPTIVSHSVIPSGPGASYLLEKPEAKTEPREQNSSTSSSSDDEKPKYKMYQEDFKPSMLYQVEYFTNQQKYIIEPHNDLDKPELSVAHVQEDAPETEYHSVQPGDPQLTFIKPKESSTNNSSSSDEERSNKNKTTESVINAQATLPQTYVVIANTEKPTKEGAAGRKCSTSSSSSEESGRLSPKLDVTVHRYETVHHVLTPDYPTTDSTEQEHPVVVVSRSFKRSVPESIDTARDDQGQPQVLSTSSEVQFSEPPMDMTYHLEYPYNIRRVTEDSDTHMQEEGIVPVVKSTSLEYEMPDLSIMLEPHDIRVEAEHGARRMIPGDEEDRSSPTWDIQTHSFETVYQVNIPEKPSTDENSFEIQEHSPIVVSRSIKRFSPSTTPGDDDLKEEPQLFTNTTDVQFSEPSNDFQLQYPEGDDLVTTAKHDLPMADEHWIVTHSVQKDKPNITAMLASLNRPEENARPKSDSSQDTDSNPRSPREKGSKDILRRGSNSRLWELMQGYLIERPLTDDDETEADSAKIAGVNKEEEPKVEIGKPETRVETTVYRVTHQPVKFETTNVPVQVGDKEPAKKVIFPVPKVESVPNVSASPSQFDPVAFQVDVGGKTPISKEHHAAWRKQASVPLDVDDNQDDPWMRHYSKGLQRGQHQPATSPEKESTFGQSRGLSLSKVPHVKGVKNSSEQEREKPRYSIESLIRTDPAPNRSSIERSQAGTTRQEPAGRPSVSSLRSLWDK